MDYGSSQHFKLIFKRKYSDINTNKIYFNIGNINKYGGLITGCVFYREYFLKFYLISRANSHKFVVRIIA